MLARAGGRRACRRASSAGPAASALRIAVGGEMAIDVSVDDAERVWSTAIERYFAKQVA